MGLKEIKSWLNVRRGLFSEGDLDPEREMKKELGSNFLVKPRTSWQLSAHWWKPWFPQTVPFLSLLTSAPFMFFFLSRTLWDQLHDVEEMPLFMFLLYFLRRIWLTDLQEPSWPLMWEGSFWSITVHHFSILFQCLLGKLPRKLLSKRLWHC